MLIVDNNGCGQSLGHQTGGIKRPMNRLWFPSFRATRVWYRHYLVWRKTALASTVGSLGEPFLYLLGMGYGLGSFIGDVGDVSYLVYVAAGILASSTMHTATFEATYGGFTRMVQQKTYHAIIVTPVRVADVVAGEILWAASKSLYAGVAIFLVGRLMGAFPSSLAIWVLPVVFLAGLTFGSMAMVVTAMAPGYDFFLYYFTLVITPMLLFCGVFYPISSLPPMVQHVAAFLPLTHVIALIRPLATGQPLEAAAVHLVSIVLYTLASYFVAAHLVRRRIII